MRYCLQVAQVEESELLALLNKHGVVFGVKEALTTGAEKLRAEGEARGLVKGQVELVLRLLKRRFVELPASAEGRVRAASADELAEIVERRWSVPMSGKPVRGHAFRSVEAVRDQISEQLASVETDRLRSHADATQR